MAPPYIQFLQKYKTEKINILNFLSELIDQDFI